MRQRDPLRGRCFWVGSTLRCAYCGASYGFGTYPDRLYAQCADCWPDQGWPRRFLLLFE